MATVLQLQPPPPFAVYSSLNDAHSRWLKWMRTFNMFVAASGVTADRQQRQLLLYTAGEEIQTIVDTHLSAKQTGTHLETLSGALEGHFKFRWLDQRAGEPFDERLGCLATKAVD